MTFYAQTQTIAHGAENESMGNMMSISRNELSVQGNPAGLSHADTVACASVSWLNYPALSGFDRLNFCAYKPFRKYRMAVSCNRFGMDQFSQHSVCLGFAHRIKSVSLGLSLSYHQSHAEGYSHRRALKVDLGGTIQLSRHLNLGTYITNVTQSRFAKTQTDVLPTVMAIGLRYTVIANVVLLVEIEKYIQYKTNLKLGMSYQMNRLLTLHTGVHGATRRIFAGLGFNSRKISIWCSYSYNYYLLSGIQLTLKYCFK